MGEKITDKKLLERIIHEDDEGYETVSEVMGDKSRWSIFMTTIFKRLSDGKLFMADWQKGATEYQENDYPDDAQECEAYQETVTNYRLVA
jgi:hypothetical protein